MQLKELRKQLAAVRAQKQAEVLKAELQALRSPPGSTLAASAAGPLGGKLHRASPEAERGLREVSTALLANVRRMEEQLEQEKATRAQLVARAAGAGALRYGGERRLTTTSEGLAAVAGVVEPSPGGRREQRHGPQPG